MTTSLREIKCLKCDTKPADLLILDYELGEAGDVYLHGQPIRKNHAYGDARAHYVCLLCESTFEHPTFLLQEDEKRKYAWDDDAPGQPSTV